MRHALDVNGAGCSPEDELDRPQRGVLATGAAGVPGGCSWGTGCAAQAWLA